MPLHSICSACMRPSGSWTRAAYPRTCTRAMGPPSCASGHTWPMTKPWEPPLHTEAMGREGMAA